MADRRAPHGRLLLPLVLSLFAVLLAGAQPVAAAEPAGYEYFHTYAETEAVIDQIVTDHPMLAEKFSIGQSYEGREIWAIKLTANVDQPTKGKPEVLINGLMHARERASAELAIYTMQVLANNYGLSGKLGKKVTRILDTTVVYVIPMMNPDGAEYDFKGGHFHKWRKNREPTPDPNYTGIDLNRQFGYTWDCCGGSSGKPKSNTYRGPAPEVAPEVQAYESFIESRNIKGEQRITEILSLHSAAKQVLWPMSYTTKNVPPDMTRDDHKAFVALGRGMAKRNGYKPQQGSDLYIVDGDQDDWAYGTQGIFALTIEMAKGSAKRYYPSEQELNADLNRNRNAVLWFLKQADCPYRAAGLAGAYCASTSNAELFSQSVYDASAVEPQQTNCWCVVASARAMLEHIDPSISESQTDINDYMTPNDRSDWTDPSFNHFLRCTSGSPSPSYAHDARGMAWTLWNYASSDQSLGFNDYRSSSRGEMNWSIVRGIRATGQPVGVIVAGGAHAILATGYQTALDPMNDAGQNNHMLGMRVWDPWYGAGFGNWSGWPTGGFAPDSYVTLYDWNHRYFLPDVSEGWFYKNYYVAVLQSSVAEPPSDGPAESLGDLLHDQLIDPTPSPTPTPSTSPASASAPATGVEALSTSMAAPLPNAAPTLERAIADGLAAHDLFGDPDLGNLPPSYRLGDAVHVTSLVSEIPSYDLVELLVGGVPRAVALVDEAQGGYLFGELRAVDGGAGLPTQAQLAAQLAGHGLHGTPSLAWTWLQDDPAPPFTPFLTGLDSHGRPAFVTPRGVVEQLPVIDGLTPNLN